MNDDVWPGVGERCRVLSAPYLGMEGEVSYVCRGPGGKRIDTHVRLDGFSWDLRFNGDAVVREADWGRGSQAVRQEGFDV